MQKFSKSLFSSLILIGLLTLTVHSQNQTFGFMEMFKIKKLKNPRLSPEGKFAVFEVTEADTQQNRWVTHLWRVHTSTGETIQMTHGEKNERRARWSPDGQLITFLSKRNGQRNIFQLNNRGGDIHKLFDHPSDITDFQYSKDGYKLYFLAKDSLSQKEKKAEENNDDAYIYDENKKPIQLWMYDLLTKSKQKIIDGNFSIREFSLSPDGNQIAFIAAPSPRQNDWLKREIYLFNLTTREQVKMTDNGIAERRLNWSPDGDYISFTSDASSYLETYYQDSIFLLNLKTQNIVDLLPEFEEQVFDYFWTSNGRYIYFTANTGLNTQFYRLDRNAGGLKKITYADHEVRSPHYQSQTDQVVYLESTPNRPFDVFFAKSNRLPGRKLTDMNSWLENYQKAKYQTIQWESTDGYQVEGILILPSDKPGRTLPLMVQLHGGPESSYRNYFRGSWSTYSQIWAAQGYAVFQPNYRGSTGYGDAVMRSIIGHYFEKDIDDIISGIDYLVQEGTVDPDKMAVMGWSAGGHLTNWLITHFERFKAACSGAGGANWFSFYAQTDVQYIREIWHVGPPYTRSEYYREKSPVNYVGNAQTPTLILCGEEDRRVPFPQSLEMYRGLDRMGCPVKFVAFPREGHGLREIRHQLHKMRVEFQWIERHLFDREWKLSDLN